MEPVYRINIRSTLKIMEPEDVFEFSRKDYKPSSIRAAAATLKSEENKTYSVSAKDTKKIIVTRVS